MSDKQKRAIEDMRSLGFTYGEIARFTKLPYNTVKSYCRRQHLTAEDYRADEHGGYNRCKNCGRELHHRPGAKRKTFCCDQCRYTWWNHIRIYGANNKRRHICRRCGTEFESYGNTNRKYCGRDCYIRDRFGEGLP